MRTLKAGVLYFLAVFGAGFLLGPLRILWLAPRVGERLAELMEMPVMLTVVFFAARWLVRRFAVAPAMGHRLAMGGTGLALLVAAELLLVLRLRGMSVADYVASRDPVSGTAYAASLLLFALMPLLVRPRSTGRRA